MNNNNFIREKVNVANNLSEISKLSANEYNKAQDDLGRCLFTAAMTYNTIIFAFVGNVKNTLYGNMWIVIVSVAAFSLSLIPWVIEKIINSAVFGRQIKISRELENNVINDVKDSSGLYAVTELAAKLLDGSRTSLIPIVSQIVLFAVGVSFSIVAIVVASL